MINLRWFLRSRRLLSAGFHMKKAIFIILTALFVLLSASAAVEFIRVLKNFSISSKIEFFFLLGFIVYLVIHMIFYKPVFIHVMSHELTHMLWAALFGGKTKELRVAREGGRVMISKSNFLISLAPYFFPLYTFIFILIYIIADKKFLPYIAFFIGASLAFHIALTLYSLMINQKDLHEDSNIVFSIVFVLFMNIIIIILVLSILSNKISFLPFIKAVFARSFNIIKWAALKFSGK